MLERWTRRAPWDGVGGVSYLIPFLLFFSLIIFLPVERVHAQTGGGNGSARITNGKCVSMEDLLLDEFLKAAGWTTIEKNKAYFCAKDAPAYMRCDCTGDFESCLPFFDPSNRNVGVCKVGGLGYSIIIGLLVALFVVILAVAYVCYLRGLPSFDGRPLPIFPVLPKAISMVLLPQARQLQGSYPVELFARYAARMRDETTQERAQRLGMPFSQEATTIRSGANTRTVGSPARTASTSPASTSLFSAPLHLASPIESQRTVGPTDVQRNPLPGRLPQEVPAEAPPAARSDQISMCSSRTESNNNACVPFTSLWSMMNPPDPGTNRSEMSTEPFE